VIVNCRDSNQLHFMNLKFHEVQLSHISVCLSTCKKYKKSSTFTVSPCSLTGLSLRLCLVLDFVNNSVHIGLPMISVMFVHELKVFAHLK